MSVTNQKQRVYLAFGIPHFVLSVLQLPLPCSLTTLKYEHFESLIQCTLSIPEQRLYCCSTSHNTAVLLEHAENVLDSRFCKNDT